MLRLLRISRSSTLILILTASVVALAQQDAPEPILGIASTAPPPVPANIAQLAQAERLLEPFPEESLASPPRMPLPENLLPFTRAQTPSSASYLETDQVPKALAPSPPPSSSFLALEDNNTARPPDTQGAVGPNHLVTTLNTQVRIQNRQGGILLTLSLEQFWSPLGSEDVFDPRILYEPYSNRWITCAVADRRSAASSLFLAVSTNSDPTGNWYFYRIDVDAANLVWADYPTLGFNRSWIVVQVNMFGMGGSFNRSHIYAFSKSTAYSGGNLQYTYFSPNNIGGTQLPAVTYDETASEVYLVQMWNGNVSGSGYLRLYKIHGAVGAELFTAVGFLSVPRTWDFTPPFDEDFAPQLGTSARIQNNDARMGSVVYRNASIWAVHHVFLPAGGAATRTAIQWWQIGTDASVIQFGRIDDSSGAAFYAFASMAVNKYSDVLIGYTRFSASQYASAAYSFRAAGDPAGTVRSEVVFKSGEAPYVKPANNENRWGDYSNTVVDPTNDFDMWTIQEYAASPVLGIDRWGTWWARVSPEPSADAHGIEVSSDVPIIVERAEYTDGLVGGELIYNALGSNSIGSTQTSANWYFPDINTTKYNVYLVIHNPTPSSASVQVNYLRQGQAPVLEAYVLPPGRPKRIHVNSNPQLANSDMAAIVTSDVGVIAEKSFSWAGTMRGNSVSVMGGSGTTGAPKALTQWYLAEGSTAGWKLWYVVMNPSSSQTANVIFNYLLEGAAPVSQTFTLAPLQKRNFFVNSILPFANVSLWATSTIPIAVERIMHWNANPGGEEVENMGGHASMGVEQLQNIWYLAEGSTAGWSMWVLLMNPQNIAVPVTVTWLREGAAPIVESYNLAPNSRKTIEVRRVPGLEFANVSVKVESTTLPILVERAMYWDSQMSFGKIYNTDGHNSPGVNNPATTWYTTATSKSYRTWVLFMNPTNQTATVTLRLKNEDGRYMVRQYSLAPNSRRTVQLNFIW